jgi:hypothetical protein
MASQGRFF